MTEWSALKGTSVPQNPLPRLTVRHGRKVENFSEPAVMDNSKEPETSGKPHILIHSSWDSMHKSWDRSSQTKTQLGKALGLAEQPLATDGCWGSFLQEGGPWEAPRAPIDGPTPMDTWQHSVDSGFKKKINLGGNCAGGDRGGTEEEEAGCLIKTHYMHVQNSQQQQKLTQVKSKIFLNNIKYY